MLLAFGSWAGAGQPARWISRGPGGGGAFFGPSINPHDPSEIFVQSDMSERFRSRDGGLNWDTMDFRVMQGGNQYSWMQFTASPLRLYGLNAGVPVRSSDGGTTWTSIPHDVWSPSVYCLHADPNRTDRLFVSDYDTIYFSSNSGASYASAFTTSDLHIAGALFDNSALYIGTRAGLVISTNAGQTFGLSTAGGIPGTEAMVTFAGAKQNGTTRLFCVTLGSGDVYPGVTGADHDCYQAVYRLDVDVDSDWQSVVNGIESGDHPFFVSMCRTNISVAWVAGGSDDGVPIVYRTEDGGANWEKVFFPSGNQNIATGWSGDDSGPWNWRKWSYGEFAEGFQVCPSDPDRALITDLGFIHLTTNGGTLWQQAYSHPADQNAPGDDTDKERSYHGVGIEDTSCWFLTWTDRDHLFASFTDIRGMLSTNGGNAWTFPASLTFNSAYRAVLHPTNGFLYAAASSVHDIYAWDRYCRDSDIDNGRGEIILSTNKGISWQTLHSFGRPVVSLALDPNQPHRLYAAMAHSASGGIYRTTNLHVGSAAVWTRLATPPRTEGHPFNIQVLIDGTLVAGYSAHITNGNFSASAGVFVSTNQGAAWLDRSDTGMRYYTKDVTIDPHDTNQQTWYAGVWGEWGNSSGLGGLYRTTNRGLAWTRITTNLQAVESCAVSPSNPDELYVTTESQGLWYTTNARTMQPQIISCTNYPFRFPTRVFFNPFDTNEIWVTSYGNGMRLGRLVEPQPEMDSFTLTASQTLEGTIRAASGQRTVLRASVDLKSWENVATNVILDDTWVFPFQPVFTQRMFGVAIW